MANADCSASLPEKFKYEMGEREKEKKEREYIV